MKSNFGKIAPTGVLVRVGHRCVGPTVSTNFVRPSSIEIRPARIRSSAISLPSNRAIDPVFLTAITFLSSIIVILTTIILSSGSLPNVNEASMPSLRIALNGGGAQHEYLARLSVKQRAQLEQQVSYVADLIRYRNKNIGDHEAHKLADAIVTISASANYDPLFVAAVIKSESTFRPGAQSPVGALGLMQIMPDTGRFVSNMRNIKWLGASSLRNVDYNIQLGIAYLKHLEDIFGGNRERALIAYNWGPANLQDALNDGTHIPSSTIKYARTILGTHGQWQRKYNLFKEQYALNGAELFNS